MIVCGPAAAWNEKGHLVVGRLAWNRLSERQRAQVVAVLKQRPHYQQFLAARKPEGCTEDEWAFLHAGTWADWVRSHYTDHYHHGPWHYINYPIVPPGSRLDPAKLQPPAGQENIVTRLPVCVEGVRTATGEERAVYLCCLFHLVGDLHQLLHCTAFYSEQFPQGDQGGNLARVRIRTSSVNLHSFWDGLLGTGSTAGAVGKDVAEIERLLKEKPDLVRDDLQAYQTFESQGKEGFELAKRAVYLNRKLRVSKAAGRGREKAAEDDVRQVPPEYASAAGRVARVQVGKAGVRLTMRLEKPFP